MVLSVQVPFDVIGYTTTGDILDCKRVWFYVNGVPAGGRSFLTCLRCIVSPIWQTPTGAFQWNVNELWWCWLSNTWRALNDDVYQTLPIVPPSQCNLPPRLLVFDRDSQATSVTTHKVNGCSITLSIDAFVRAPLARVALSPWLPPDLIALAITYL